MKLLFIYTCIQVTNHTREREIFTTLKYTILFLFLIICTFDSWLQYNAMNLLFIYLICELDSMYRWFSIRMWQPVTVKTFGLLLDRAWIWLYFPDFKHDYIKEAYRSDMFCGPRCVPVIFIVTGYLQYFNNKNTTSHALSHQYIMYFKHGKLS